MKSVCVFPNAFLNNVPFAKQPATSSVHNVSLYKQALSADPKWG